MECVPRLRLQCVSVARPIAEEFGAAFRRAYTDAGLTQVELAERLQAQGWPNVDQRYISRWARGLVVPPLEILPAVDAACGQPKGYVLELVGFVDARALADRERPDPFSRLPRRSAAGARGRRRPAV